MIFCVRDPNAAKKVCLDILHVKYVNSIENVNLTQWMCTDRNKMSPNYQAMYQCTEQKHAKTIDDSNFEINQILILK